MIISEIATCHLTRIHWEWGMVSLSTRLRYLTTMFRGEFLTKLAPAATDALMVHFRCRTTVPAGTAPPNFAQNLTSAATFGQPRLSRLSNFGSLLLFGPFFGLALEKISHGAWTGLVYGRQRERLLHFVHFDVGSGLGENLREWATFPVPFHCGGRFGLGFLGGLEDCGLSVPPEGYWAGALLPPGVTGALSWFSFSSSGSAWSWRRRRRPQGRLRIGKRAWEREINHNSNWDEDQRLEIKTT